MGFSKPASPANPQRAGFGARPAAQAAPSASAQPKPRAQRAAPVLKPAAGRYSGLKEADSKYPLLEGGSHRVEFVDSKERKSPGKKPWLVTNVKVLSSDTVREGSLRTIIKCVSDEAFVRSGPEIKSMVRSACGYDDEDAFEAAHPDWDTMIDAVHGVREAEQIHGENPLAGMIALVDVVEQPANEHGIVYTNQTWYPDRAEDSA